MAAPAADLGRLAAAAVERAAVARLVRGAAPVAAAELVARAVGVDLGRGGAAYDERDLAVAPDPPQVVEFGGPEALTQMQVVAAFEAATSTAFKVRHIPTLLIQIVHPVLARVQPDMALGMGLQMFFDTHASTWDDTPLRDAGIDEFGLHGGDLLLEQFVNAGVARGRGRAIGPLGHELLLLLFIDEVLRRQRAVRVGDHVGRRDARQVVRHDVGGFLEPEVRDSGQDLALAGNRFGHDDVEGGQFDGIEFLEDGRALVSNWATSCVHILETDGTLSCAMPDIDAPADIGVDHQRGRVLVPLFNANEVRILPLG